MIILGIHDGHTASAALSINGEIIFAAQEERFTKVKIQEGFPKKTVEYILEKFSLTGNDIDKVVFSTIDIGFTDLYSRREEQHTIKDWIQEMDEYWNPKLKGESYNKNYLLNLRNKNSKYIPKDDIYEYPDFLFELPYKEGVEQFNAIRRKAAADLIGINPDNVEFYDHHTCHIYYSYYSNPNRKSDTIGFTLDSYGDGKNQTVWKIENDHFDLIEESSECDLGRLYKIATLYLGMRPNEHEFKVMGLAPYVKEKYANEVYEELKDLLHVQGMKIVHKNRPVDLYQFMLEKLRPYRFDSVAAGLQKYLEVITKEFLINVHTHTGAKNFVFSGGVSMNVKLNKVLGELDFVEDFFVCGSSSDESLSIGACYVANNRHDIKNRALPHLYLGSYESQTEIDEYIKRKGLDKKFSVRHGVKNNVIAKMLADGQVVARMCGKMEFGARSLGNRSILANPSNTNIVKEINEMIKGRDFWMPFALTILDSCQTKYIKNSKGYESRYMATSFDTKPEYLHEIQAGTHQYDNTVRPQILSREQNESYYDLIKQFEEISGIGALLNTSFNLHGLPMVNDIQDAIHVFENSGLEHLLIDEILISKAS